MTNNSEEDLKKAVAFLLEKEMRDYTLDKKREFLLKKLSPEIVDKALSLLPTIESNVNERIDEYIKYNKKGFLDSFFDIGVISSVLLATLGINYIIDLNRNKKNDLFYKDIEKKINEEMNKNTQEMNNDISNKLNSYVSNENLNERINSQLITYTQQRGLNLNLSSKSLKDNISTLRNDMNSMENKIKELNVKLDNNNLLLKQEMTKEIINVIEENNQKLLLQIIDHQNKLILSIKDKEMKSNSKEPEQNLINLLPILKDENSIIEIFNDEKLTFLDLLNNILLSVTDSKLKFNFLSQLRNQFSAIIDGFENPSDHTIKQINIKNNKFSAVNSNLLKNLLTSAGFILENNSTNIYTILPENAELLKKSYNLLEEIKDN